MDLNPRHPVEIELMAWHDGELSEERLAEVGLHLESCESCWDRAAELAAVDRLVASASVSASSRVAPVPVPVPVRRVSFQRAAMAFTAAAAVVAAWGLSTAGTPAPSVAPGPLAINGTVTGEGRTFEASGDQRPAAADSPASSVPKRSAAGDVVASAATGSEVVTAPGLTAPRTESGPTASALASPLRIGLFVPLTTGRLGERDEIIRAVDVVVQAANAAGGVGGAPVSYATTSPDRPTGDFDVLVGGATSTDGEMSHQTAPWILPVVDTPTSSNVVGALPEPGSAAKAAISALPLNTVVAVIDGDDREDGFAGFVISALGGRARRVTLDGRAGCDPEMSAAVRSGASSLVLAMRPDFAADCLEALTRQAKRPGQVVLAPSSVSRPPTPAQARAFEVVVPMALPWPTWNDPAAARFRRATGSKSYRAMLSFAATEFAVTAARRSSSPLTIDSFAGEVQTDLFTQRDGGLVARHVGVADGVAWTPRAEEG